MPIFLAVVFLSAFLLFQVQPVIARYILPWYGGSPGVWTTCLLFFQVGLLGGYAYAHALVTFFREKRRWQVGIHLSLLALAFVLLPITPSEAWKPDASESGPVEGIVRLLAVTVGFPYLLLSASGPLLQHWFSEIFPDRSPYRLYAVSNFGSLLGLLTYPFLFEPLLTVPRQTALWSVAFVVYGLLVIAAAVLFVTRASPRRRSVPDGDAGVRPAKRDVFLWIAFSACGSMLLLSLTSQMCQDVAVVPFLWVLPLSLYLLTFVIAFDHERWYRRSLAIPLAAAAVGLTIWLMNRQYAATEWPLSRQIAIYCAAVFFACLICHGEIVRRKPHSSRLTGFYLSISLGGALGGLFVNLLAPRLFTGYWELHLAFALLAVLTSLSLGMTFPPLRRVRNPLRGAPIRHHPGVAILALPLWGGALAAMGLSLRHHIHESQGTALAAKRGFYGVLQVSTELPGTEDEYRSLYHGRISHGRQYRNDAYRRLATTYYSVDSGVGAVFSLLPAREKVPPAPLHVGVVGLGVGTIATYAAEGDRFRLYEINPQVEELARSHFTYLADSAGEASVVLGDARISLERELTAGRKQEFDALFVDAFSGDSIPIHLLTREAFALYFEHLKPDGVLAVHITNLHIDLADPVRNLAAAFGYAAFRVDHSPESDDHHTYYSDWVLITKNEAFIQALESSAFLSAWDREVPKEIFWTDDYSNLFDVVF
ncbi:MAG: fused MFS/spermidine synthase [Verrucomicrobiaceae bacterium]|nr:fused MFS/spermidine synthase [Verrucomicrobiaceae bacterium]